MENDKTDYKKYRYIKVTGDIYSNYRLDNFNITKNKNKQINVTTSINNDRYITDNNDVSILRDRIENTSKNTNASTSNINNEHINYCKNDLKDVTIKNDIGKSNSNVNFNLKTNKNDKSIIKNSKKNNSNKGKKNYYKFINDIDIDRIINENYEENEKDNTYDNISDNASNHINNNTYKAKNNTILDERSSKKNVIKKDKNTRHKTGGIIGGFVVLFIFVVTFFLCNFLLPNSLNTETSEYFLYAVCKSAVSKSDAESISIKFISKGAGGYIYEEDNKYFVIADIFEKEESANSIIKNSNNNNTFDTVKKLYIKKYCFKYIEPNLTSNVKSALNYIDICYFDLHKIALLYNQKDIDKIEAKERINRLKLELERLKKFYDKNTKNTSSNGVISIKSELNFCLDMLDDLIKSNNLSADIRMCYIKVIINYINIINNSYTK